MMSPDINRLSNDSPIFNFNNFNTISNSNSSQQKPQKLNQLLSELNELIDNKSNNNVGMDRESRRLLIDLLQKYITTNSRQKSEDKSPLKPVIISQNIQ